MIDVPIGSIHCSHEYYITMVELKSCHIDLIHIGRKLYTCT